MLSLYAVRAGDGLRRLKRPAIATWCLVFAANFVNSSAAPYAGAYALQESLVGSDFFAKWTFFTGADPTHGIVNFVSEEDAFSRGIVSAADDRVYMGVDTSEVLSGNQGRAAVKILSNAVYNNGLFVLELDHVPSSCGSWPAFWMFGEDAQHAWPRWGEYDILESVHNISYATTTLHTRNNCDQAAINTGIDFSGSGWATNKFGGSAKDCYVNAPTEFSNQGCGQKAPAGSFGDAFNKAGGGTWVADWDPQEGHIRTWFFAKGQEPLDLKARQPRPSHWGTPTSFFTLDQRFCSASHFKNMRVVFDTTFCGDYGTATFASSCPHAGMSCKDFVQQKPKAFSEAYWGIRALDVYKRPDYASEEIVPLGASPDTESGSASAASGGANPWPWFCSGVVLTGAGMTLALSVRYMPAKAKTFRGIPESSGPLQDCLDMNVASLQQEELQVEPPGPQDYYGQQQFARGSNQQPQAAFPGAGALAYVPNFFRSNTPQVLPSPQPNVGRTVSSSSQQGSSSFFNFGGVPQRPPSYVPAQQSFQQPTAGGGGSWQSFIWRGVQNVTGGAPATPVGSRSGNPNYSLPPTLNALGPGHLPPNYQPLNMRGT